MDNLNPQGSAQPMAENAYANAQNAASKEPAEKTASHLSSGKGATDKRGVADNDGAEPTPTSLGRGIHGAGPGEDSSKYSDDDFRKGDYDGEQMRAPGEGETADVVNRKPGASGAQMSLTSDLEEKKEEQAPLREGVQEERKKGASEGVDVQGAINAAHHRS